MSAPSDDGTMRGFDTGATRGTSLGKPDYEGFLSPLVIARYGEYMDEHRTQADGKLRDSDNWQKGIPQSAYMKSGWRHFFDWWSLYRRDSARTLDYNAKLEEALCALMFNVMGYLHEHILRRAKAKAKAVLPWQLAGTPVPSKHIQALIHENGKWRNVE